MENLQIRFSDNSVFNLYLVMKMSSNLRQALFLKFGVHGKNFALKDILSSLKFVTLSARPLVDVLETAEE